MHWKKTGFNKALVKGIQSKSPLFQDQKKFILPAELMNFHLI